MSLSRKQWDFLLDVSELIAFIDTVPGMYATGGELFRTPEQQQLHIANGRSQTYNSKHLKRLAIDFNFFYDGQYVGALPTAKQIELVKPIGDFWESLHHDNVWGGNWKTIIDVPHFERG